MKQATAFDGLLRVAVCNVPLVWPDCMPSLVQEDGHGEEQQEELQEPVHNRGNNAHGHLKGSLLWATPFLVSG